MYLLQKLNFSGITFGILRVDFIENCFQTNWPSGGLFSKQYKCLFEINTQPATRFDKIKSYFHRFVNGLHWV